jgi:NitT/TauT family transport system ATP-binding protein
MTRRPPPVRTPAAGITVAMQATTMQLHPVSINLLAGLMEAVAAPPYDGKADLPPLAAALQLEIDEILPICEAMAMMRFADLEEGDLKLTDSGRTFVAAEMDDRKSRFAEALRTHVPLAATIRQVLDERWNHRASAVRFRDELEDHMSPEYADDTLHAVIGWGRYAELFGYDEEADQFFLDEEE